MGLVHAVPPISCSAEEIQILFRLISCYGEEADLYLKCKIENKS